MRAAVGADVARAVRAARRPASRSSPPPTEDGYIAFWEAITDGADNVAYRLALNTLVAAQRSGAIDPDLYAAERDDLAAQRALAAAIAAGDGDAAERSPAHCSLERAAVSEVLYYAIPFFVLLLIAEARPSGTSDDDHDLVGYEFRDSRTSLTMGLGNVDHQRRLEGRRRARLRRALRAHAAAPGPRRLVGLGAAVLRRRLLVLLVPPHQPREPRLLGQPRRPPLQPALQPLDRAAPDLGADDLLPVLAVDAARRLPGLDDPARPGLEPHLPVLDPHGARS